MSIAKPIIHFFAKYLAVFFFVAGFLWDALTIGIKVQSSDLIFLAAYLLSASVILYHIASPENWVRQQLQTYLHHPQVQPLSKKLALSIWPYLALQFLFGSLLSALFIMYFKSASYVFAWSITLLLGALLVANEFLQEEYRKLTLCWSIFGLCAMLLFNFCLPFLLGSIHTAWFYISTLLGAVLTHVLFLRAEKYSSSIVPTWLIAATLMFFYKADMIPPVPLVKREMEVAYQLEKTPIGDYRLTQQASPWWMFWRKADSNLIVTAGHPVYFFSAVFAPVGLKTRLYHHWQWRSPQGWMSQSRIGFSLKGGRDQGYRGYTFKRSLRAGEWRVLLQTESNQTIADYSFTITLSENPLEKITHKY